MIYSTTNNTASVMLSPAERYCILGYHLIIVISSLIGDTIVLVATIKYRAIKLHKFIVGLIVHIAVCDLTLTFSYVMPAAISLAADGWIFGNLLLCIRVYVTWFSFSASVFFVCALTSSKLFILKHPLRSRSLTERNVHVMCGCIWIISGYMPTLFFIIDKDDVKFDPLTYYGEYGYNAATWDWLVPLSATLLAAIPNTVTIVNTICITLYLVEARNVARVSGGRLVWHGLLTVVATAVVCSVASMPMALYFVTSRQNMFEGRSADSFHVVARYLTLLNVMSNFFIYCVTVPSFRKFIKIKVFGKGDPSVNHTRREFNFVLDIHINHIYHICIGILSLN